ncbi:glycoside hydrolase [Dendryphion nanum]|uniref:alpha-1,2-Mannosidase n=1 Tax=Dendryphion nanum TaxID=256645 RepID=A0A9P9EK24_9PLEO|nr:glycoside hydrolase [Dendryphion nanum]
MALLRRYGIYAAITATFLYVFYSLSFPYEPSHSSEGVHQQPQHPHHEEPQEHEHPQEPVKIKSYDWSKVSIQHPIESFTPLPSGEAKPLPKIQFDFKEETTVVKNIREKRRDEVKKAFEKCWKNYRQKAWMHDELSPISGGSKDPFGGWGATLIDALDTLWIMGFKEEFMSAIKDVERIDFGFTGMDKINVFETNIRYLGGLLAAYELSGHDTLLKKAKEVGEMLYHAFDTPNHMPITRWDSRKAGEGEPQVADETALLAEIGSLSLEFSRLSALTNDPKWYDAIARITTALEQQQSGTKLPGMWPILVNMRKPDFTYDTSFTLASMADSAYEYLPKTYALLGGLESSYKSMYLAATETAIKHTIFRPMTPDNADIRMSGFVRAERSTANLYPEMQHLGCYTGGMFALGGKIFSKPDHIDLGRKLADACVWAYKNTPSGIMPEKSHLFACPDMSNCTWDESAWKAEVASLAELGTEKDPLQNIANLRLPQGYTAMDDRSYLLRPEAIESVFLLYRITGGQQWQAAAWDMFTAIQHHTDTELGNAALEDVSAENPPKIDSMESFWLGETLKYFYLIFSQQDVMSLDEWVFNTEAHAFKLPKTKGRVESETSGFS